MAFPKHSPPPSPLSNTVLSRTGGFTTSDALTTFLYLLLRDHLPFGTVETLVLELEEYPPAGGILLSNQSLGIYASDLADRIRDQSHKKSEDPPVDPSP